MSNGDAQSIEPQESACPVATPGDHPCPVVGIGASAGGLDAFENFFANSPPDTGMAFVLVQHLDPRHETLMPELLARRTTMPVRQVDGDVQVTPNHVYVLPPDALVSVDDCKLLVTRPAGRRGRRSPIDHFFRSLALDQAEVAVAIVLSGTGTDGALGLKAVKDAGGLTMVQSPATAKHDSMPRSALLTGRVDWVLPVEAMPAKLVERRDVLRALGADRDLTELREEVAPHLGEISEILRGRVRHDFSRYKESTLIRRIRRRMQLHSETAAAYVERLRRDEQEVGYLFQDLLIGVTHFFRDPDAFAALEEEALPKVFARKEEDGEVRVWVPGCASGEEAYSIAILLAEQLARSEARLRVQLFATDIDEQALEAARQGWYPEAIAEQVTPERLERFFVKHGNLYQVAKEVRDLCLFTPHNLIADPPFSRLDLISCRNLLIYLERDLQRRLIPLCHYALLPGGYLFLGPSESVASHPELFRMVDKKHRIFQRKDTPFRTPLTFPLADRPRPVPPRALAPEHRRRDQADFAHTFERLLLEGYAPASVVVNERGEAVYFSPRTGRYLEPPAGPPTTNVLEMTRKGLRLDLRTAIHKAVTGRREAVQENVAFEVDGRSERVNLVVRPLPELGEDSDLYLVVFQELTPVHAPVERVGEAGRDHPEVQRLESELRMTKEHLQATLEELESSNEELVSSNEELLSINEELQSANEELQTSKEELQSVNEELETVNAELKKKVEELDRANSDLQNLLQSTQIPTIFVDGKLRIKKFTPAATDVFRLIESDAGRPIADIAPRFAGGDELAADIQAVLRTLAAREREVSLADGGPTYILRILPYRTVDNVIDGVVMTFSDVTDMKRAQEQRAQLAAIVEWSQDAIYGKTLDGVITHWNAAAERLYGWRAEEAIGQPVSLLAPPDHVAELDPILAKLRQGQVVAPFETVRVRKDGTRIDVLLVVSPIRGADERVIGASAIARDITDRKRAEEALRLSEERYRALASALSSVVWTTDAAGRFAVPQASWEAYSGQPWERHAGFGWVDCIHPDDREQLVALWQRAVAEHTQYRAEGRVWHAQSYRYRHCVARGVPLFGGDGTVREWVGTLTDVDDRKRAEEALTESARRKDEFLAMLGHELRNPLAPIRHCLAILELANATEEQKERAQQTIERQVTHLTRMVDDLLDVSRISRGKILLKPERLDLVALVRTEVEDRRAALEGRGLAVELDLPQERVAVAADPTRLSQAIGNVLHNAGKFTDRGGRIEVRVTAEREERGGPGWAVVAVRDTGIGMEPEMLARLFETFSQAERGLDRSRGGLGLGLALVKALVELHHGTVTAASAGAGHGTEVVLRLPLELQRELPLAPPPAGTEADAVPRRCLIVEDNPDAAESLALLLELAGHRVAVAHDGPSGVATAQSFRPEVVICDIGLPGEMDGYAVARALRAEPDLEGVLLVALTGYGQEEDQRRAREAGFDTHLTKPTDIAAIKKIIARLP